MALEVSFTVTFDPGLTSVTFTDTTGAYNASSNPTGYGAPNPTVAAADVVEVEITPFGGSTTYTIDVSADLPSSSDGSTTIDTTDIGGSSATSIIADGIYLYKYTVGYEYTISGCSTVTDTFVITGDVTAQFSVGQSIEVEGSSGNDGTYTIETVTLNGGGNTEIAVTTDIPVLTSTGNIVAYYTHSQYELFYGSLRECYLQKLAEVNVEDCNCETDDLVVKIDKLLAAAKYAALCGKVNKASEMISYLTTLCSITPCTTC